MTITHGTHYTYQRAKCRCDLCKAACAVVNKRYKEIVRERAQRERARLDASRAAHGLPPLPVKVATATHVPASSPAKIATLDSPVHIYTPFAAWSAERLRTVRHS